MTAATTAIDQAREDRVGNVLKWVLLGIAIGSFILLGWATEITYRTAPPQPDRWRQRPLHASPSRLLAPLCRNWLLVDARDGGGVASVHADAVRGRAAVPAPLDHYARARRPATFRAIEWLHRILLVLSLITVFGAVAGSYGF